MKKINKLSTIIVLLLITLLGASGCADKRIILVPQAEYYPTFPTQDFNVSKKIHFEYWVETEDVNGTTEIYLVTEKKDFDKLLQEIKKLRMNYNTLLENIKKFNVTIKEINVIQQNKKPTEIESIKDSWFK